MAEQEITTRPDQPREAASFRLSPEKPLSFVKSLPDNRQPDKIIILLPGMSHSGAAIMRQARTELRELEPKAAIYAVNAPFLADPNKHRLASKPRKRGESRVWYELPDGRRNVLQQIREQLAVSVRHVHRMMDHALAETGLSEKEVILIGFSQGCGPAFQAMIERKNPLGALICTGAGILWDPKIFDTEEKEKGKQVPSKAYKETPVFYHRIKGDDKSPDLLQMHSLYVLKKHGTDTVVYTAPDMVSDHFFVDGKGRVRSLRYKKPTELEFSTPPIIANDPRLSKMGPHDLRPNPHAILRFKAKEKQAESPATLFGYIRKLSRFLGTLITGRRPQPNLSGKPACCGVETNFRATAHFVSPRAKDAMILWHYKKIAPEEFGMQSIKFMEVRKIPAAVLEAAWAVRPTVLDARKPIPLPAWHHPHEAFDKLTRRMKRHLNRAVTHVFSALASPLRNQLYMMPEPVRRLTGDLLAPHLNRPKKNKGKTRTYTTYPD